MRKLQLIHGMIHGMRSMNASTEHHLLQNSINRKYTTTDVKYACRDDEGIRASLSENVFLYLLLLSSSKTNGSQRPLDMTGSLKSVDQLIILAIISDILSGIF